MNRSGARALVVEDDPSWQQILSELLTDAGLSVDVADSLETAVERLRANAHRLAVVDLSLDPGDHNNRDGLLTLEAARRLDPGCVTILLTGFATVELAVSALTEYGAFTCLRKDTFSRAEFREVIARALASAPAAVPGQPELRKSTSQLRPSTVEVQEPPARAAAGLALVVEDDAGWRSILSELLTDAGYRVHLSSGLGEAMGWLRREKYALAVVDLSLSPLSTFIWGERGQGVAEEELSGYRLLASTRAAGVPTIVISGVATPADIERAYTEHAIFAFVEKQTFDRHTFLRIVEEVRTRAGGLSGLNSLTAREREVLELLAKGMTNKEIAEALVITPNTVKRHLKAIFEKLDVHTRSAAVAMAVEAGIQAE
jgi:Response regulator containing a CheY-like receiver domain and an HTH DNA-binding domain